LEKDSKPLSSFENLMENESSLAKELVLLVSNIRKEVCGVLYSFLSFLKKYEENKAHNMVSLMLDFRFKNLRIMYSSIVQKYDKKSLYPLLIKCYEHLHLSMRRLVNEGISKFGHFRTKTSTNELVE
jgi:hypothetical protein